MRDWSREIFEANKDPLSRFPREFLLEEYSEELAEERFLKARKNRTMVSRLTEEEEEEPIE